MVTQAGYFGFFVHDLEAATVYYRDRLGLTFDEAQSIPGQFAQFNLPGGVALALFQDDPVQTGAPQYELGLLVDDADSVYQTWKERGVAFVEDAPQDLPFGRTFQVRTPEEHRLRVIQLHPVNP